MTGAGHPSKGAEGGYWLGPCLIDGVSPTMQVYRDEIFGPVLSLVRVDSLDQALDLIADNGYGNGAAIFTGDGAAAQRFETEVEAGMVGVNIAIPVPVSSYSFGGWQGSLFGDLHVYGPDGVRFYTRGKAVTSRWNRDRRASRHAGVPEFLRRRLRLTERHDGRAVWRGQMKRTSSTKTTSQVPAQMSAQGESVLASGEQDQPSREVDVVETAKADVAEPDSLRRAEREQHGRHPQGAVARLGAPRNESAAPTVTRSEDAEFGHPEDATRSTGKATDSGRSR